MYEVLFVKHNYHAITLQKYDIGEMDRLYTFYTRENGLVRVPARSIRKMSAKLPMQVEDFVFSHITVAQNYGRGTLTGAVAEEYFVDARADYDALVCMDIARNVFLTIMDENDSNAEVFDLLMEYLHKMNVLAHDGCNHVVAQMQWITHAFLIHLFVLEGYAFDASRCCVCKQSLEQKRNGFSAHRGGVVCERCLPGHNCCRVDPDTVKALRVIQTNKFSTLTKVMIHAVVQKQMRMVVGDIERWVMR